MEKALNHIGEAFTGLPIASKISQLFGDSRQFNFLSYEGQMDLVFVDADHSYEGVQNDTRQALKLVRPGGVVVWDDYHPSWLGVMRCLEEFGKSLPIVHIQGTRLAFYRAPNRSLGN